jgi:hypothetical protein
LILVVYDLDSQANGVAIQKMGIDTGIAHVAPRSAQP